MIERRHRRAPKVSDAITHFLEALCLKRGLEAAALTTDDGLLIAGVGHLDLEWMGALGASSSKRSLDWEHRSLHVSRFEVNDVPVCLTTAGAPIRDDGAVGSIMRIFAT
jgi:hypothetical protein